MPRKYYNKVAIATYAAILVSVSSFISQFVYEGWTSVGIKPLLSPLGITAATIFVVAIILFVWNLRREELTHEQWLEIRNKRQPDLIRLRNAIGEYVKATFQCMKNPVLYSLNEGYHYSSKPNGLLLFRDIGTTNTCYVRIVNDELGDARVELEDIASRLSNKRIRKYINQLFRRTNIARSYQIFLKIYRTQYSPAPAIEKYILQHEPLSALAKYVSKVYAYIDIMERGKDLD